MEDLKNCKDINPKELIKVPVLQLDGTISNEFRTRAELSLLEPWTPERERREKREEEEEEIQRKREEEKELQREQVRRKNGWLPLEERTGV